MTHAGDARFRHAGADRSCAGTGFTAVAVVERVLEPGTQVIVYPGDMVSDGVGVKTRKGSDT